MPRTRTKVETVYKYAELSHGAQQKALADWSAEGWYDGSENRAALDAFEKIFPVRIRDWNYGYPGNYVSFSFEADEEIEELSGVRLMTYLYNNYFRDLFQGKYYSLWSKTEKSLNNPNMGKLKFRHSKVIFDNSCVLTGVWIDHELLDPIYKFLKKPDSNVNFKDLMDDCLQSWANAASDDMDSYYSEESFKEMCEANDWEFYENGKHA